MEMALAATNNDARKSQFVTFGALEILVECELTFRTFQCISCDIYYEVLKCTVSGFA